MIEAYLLGIPSLYEGESIEVRYCICEDQNFIRNHTELLEYRKPALVGLVSLRLMLFDLEKYLDQKITIIVNDGALVELMKGTSTTKNPEVQRLAKETKRELLKYTNMELKDVSSNHIELAKWNAILKF